MFKKMMKISSLLLFLICFEFASVSTYAQAAQGLTPEEKTELTGTRKQVATIVFAGLAGAILGLSTLSFYGRPQEHLTNIAIGGAFGVIGGAIFTTYRAATRPYEAYDIARIEESSKYQNSIQQNRIQNYTQQDFAVLAQNLLSPQFTWAWTF